MNKFLPVLLYGWLGWLLPNSGLAQAAANAIRTYHTTTSHAAGFYNGKEYTVAEFRPTGHQYFISRDWLKSSFVYDGERYEQLPGLYDIHREKFLIKHFNGMHSVELQNDMLEEFVIDNHHFKHIRTGLKPGFYEVLYDGPTKVFSKRYKDRREDLSEMRVNIIYDEKDSYFILKDGVYYPISRRKSALSVLERKRKELRKLVSTFEFKRDKSTALAEMAAYYDQSR